MLITLSLRGFSSAATIALHAGCSGGSAASPISSIGSQRIGHQSAQCTQSLTRAGILGAPNRSFAVPHASGRS